MKTTMIRTLALVLALMLSLPALVLADEETGILSLPDEGIDLGDMGDLDSPELDGGFSGGY